MLPHMYSTICVDMCWCDTCHLLNLARYGSDVSDVSVCSEQFYHYRLAEMSTYTPCEQCTSSVQTLIMYLVGAVLLISFLWRLALDPGLHLGQRA